MNDERIEALERMKRLGRDVLSEVGDDEETVAALVGVAAVYAGVLAQAAGDDRIPLNVATSVVVDALMALVELGILGEG